MYKILLISQARIKSDRLIFLCGHNIIWGLPFQLIPSYITINGFKWAQSFNDSASVSLD